MTQNTSYRLTLLLEELDGQGNLGPKPTSPLITLQSKSFELDAQAVRTFKSPSSPHPSTPSTSRQLQLLLGYSMEDQTRMVKRYLSAKSPDPVPLRSGSS